MKIIQNTKDTLYVLREGKMIAHINTSHILSEMERAKLLELLEVMNET